MLIIKQAEFFFLPLFFVFVGLMMGDGLKWKAEILRDGCVSIMCIIQYKKTKQLRYNWKYALVVSSASTQSTPTYFPLLFWSTLLPHSLVHSNLLLL